MYPDTQPKERVPGISGRELGVGVPVSIGTSIAMESALGLLPEHETAKPVINDYDAVWINLRTIYRNLMGAMETESRKTLMPEEIAEAINNEMMIIQSAISDKTRGLVSVVFYVCNFSSLNRRFPHAAHRNVNTQNQQTSYTLEQTSIRMVLDSGTMADVRKFDIEFGESGKKVLLVTHQPIDLLNRYKFGKLDLLETHTGAIKPPSRWYTKLNGGKDLVNIPFDRMTLQVFGDSTMFSPMNLKIRRHLVELAKKHGWTYLTTRDYVMKCIKDERDPNLEAYVMKFYY